MPGSILFWRRGLHPGKSAAPSTSAYWKASRHFDSKQEIHQEESRLIVIRSSKKRRSPLTLEPVLYPPPKRQKKCTMQATQVKKPQEALLWTEKYAPKARGDIVGNQNLILRLHSWLQTWEESLSRNSAPGLKTALLISGPPGVGKSIAAVAVSKELEFVIVSALSIASKEKKLGNILSELLNNRSLTVNSSGLLFSRKTVLIVDEMDQLEDSTIQSLSDFVRRGKLPVICICNDRYHKRIRKFADYCVELKFQKPKTNEILKLLFRVQEEENVLVDKEFLKLLVDSAQRDVRQSLLQMQYLCAGNPVNRKLDAKVSMSSSFAVVDSLCAESGIRNNQPLKARINLILEDFEFVALLVQENYINYKPAKLRKEAFIMDSISKASDYLCVGDMTSKSMHKHRTWELTNLLCAVLALTCSSVLQGRRESFDAMEDKLRFPAWLTKGCKRKNGEGRLDCRFSELDILPPLLKRQALSIPAFRGPAVEDHAFKQTTDELFALLKECRH